MHIPKNYFHDRLVLLLISANVFIAVITSLLVVFKVQNGDSDGFVGQYHANLGLSAFEPGSAATFVSFALFAALVVVVHTILSMRMYYRRRDYAIAVLWMGLVLLVFGLVVSNALSVLQ